MDFIEKIFTLYELSQTVNYGYSEKEILKAEKRLTIKLPGVIIWKNLFYFWMKIQDVIFLLV